MWCLGPLYSSPNSLLLKIELLCGLVTEVDWYLDDDIWTGYSIGRVRTDQLIPLLSNIVCILTMVEELCSWLTFW